MKHFIPCLAILCAATTASYGDTKAQLRKALFAEEVERDTAKAAAIYQHIIDEAGEGPRQLAVARFRLANIHRAAGRHAEALALLKTLAADPETPADWMVMASRLLEAANTATRSSPSVLPDAVFERLKDKLWDWHAGSGKPHGTLRFLPDGKLETTRGIDWLTGWSPMSGNRIRIRQVEGKFWVMELAADGLSTAGVQAPGVADPFKFLKLHSNPAMSIDEAEIEYLTPLVEGAPDKIAEWGFPGSLARCNRTKALAYLFDHGVPVDLRQRGKWSYTALMSAARSGEPSTVRFLLDRGADVNARDAFGATPLFIAAWDDRPETVRLLLDRGADIRASSPTLHESDQALDYGTALHCAIQRGNRKVFDLLLDRGADINAVSPTKQHTPLFLAILVGRTEMAEELLRRGADPNLPVSGLRNPLRRLAYEGNLTLLRKLLDKGAKPGIQSEETWEMRGIMRSVGAALHNAARAGNLNVMKTLADAGCQIDQASPIYQETPLHAGALHGNTMVCRWLLEKGAAVSHRLSADIGLQSGWTPLHSAACGKSAEVVALLLEKGASASEPCAVPGLSRTPFQVAVLTGNLMVVKAMLDHPRYQPAEERSRLLVQADAKGDTALHLAVSREAVPNADLVRLLVASGAPLGAVNGTNRTPRQLANDPESGGTNPAVRAALGP